MADGPFFIFGGLAMTPQQAVQVHGDICQIRDQFGYLAGDSFKFQTASRPPQVSIDDFRRAKSAAIKVLERRKVPMITYVILHQIATKGIDENSLMALNALLSHFNFKYLAPAEAHGMVTIDRINERQAYPHLQSVITEGVSFPDGRTEPLPSLMHVSFSADNLSHLSSLVDIALGSFRYCVNSAFGHGNADVASEMMPALGRALWHEQVAGMRQIGGFGYLAYPRDIRVPQYRDMYARLVSQLSEWAQS